MIAAAYSVATGWVHQAGIIDAGAQVRASKPGEAIVQVDQPTFDAWVQQWQSGSHAYDALQGYVNQVRGAPPVPADYAIVSGGIVVNVVGNADPALGHLDYELATNPGCLTVLTSGVVVGATYLNGVFTNPVQAVKQQQVGA